MGDCDREHDQQTLSIRRNPVSDFMQVHGTRTTVGRRPMPRAARWLPQWPRHFEDRPGFNHTG